MKFTMIAAATAMMLASASQAAVTVYTDQSAFAAAMGALTTEDFNDAVLVPGLSITTNAGTIGGGVFNDRVFRGGDTTTFSFAGGARGAGGIFDLTPGGFGQALSFTLNLSGGGTELVPSEIAQTVGTFFGFISTNRFDSFLITAGSNAGSAETYTLDNLQFGGAVPEPGTWLLMVVGFGLVGAGMRKRSTVVAA